MYKCPFVHEVQVYKVNDRNEDHLHTPYYHVSIALERENSSDCFLYIKNLYIAYIL